MIGYRSEYVIALGGNLPSERADPAETLALALAEMVARRLTIRALSRFYATPCFPAGAGPDFVNAAARVTGPEDPQAVLATLHEIETGLGRVRTSRWAGRTLDLDLLAAGNRVLPDAAKQAAWRNLPQREQARRTPADLILPHPRLQDRAFVLIPMRDVAPDWVHPLVGQSVAALCSALPKAEIASIRPL